MVLRKPLSALTALSVLAFGVLAVAQGVDAGGLEIRVTPASIPADQLRRPVEFLVELGKATSPPGLEVELILAVPGGSTRTLKTRSADGRIFRVTAPPVPVNEPARVRLTLLDDASEAVFWATDRSFSVGGKPVRLSNVRRIDLGASPRVALREGEPITGPLQGLERIVGQVAGTAVQFETSRASRLLVGEIETQVASIIYRVAVRQKGKVLGERLGLLTVSENTTSAVRPPAKSRPPIGFLPPVVYKVPGAKDIITAGDLDGDRCSDVVVAADEEVGILYGRRDGTLEPYQVLVPWKGKPANRALADLNGDGLPEILFRDHVGRLVILQNQGDRRFAEPRFQDVGGGNAVEVGDFNEDGRPDLALNGANGGRGYVKLYLAEADGTFTAHSTVSVSHYAEALAVRDLNGDKHLDLAVGYVSSSIDRSGVALFYGDGTGKFANGPSYNIGSQNMPGVALEDLNGDGKPDLSVTHYWAGEIAVLMNKGDGSFLPLVRYPAGSYPIQIRSADVNGDGKPDLVVPNAGKGQVSIFRNRGDGTFHDPIAVLSGGENSRSCAIADFNRDGRPDVVVQHESSRTIGVLLNNTGG